VIVAIVLVNALIGFFQEERAQTALSALERMAAPVATVVRDGVPSVLPAREIVPGDLLALAAGDAVAADARIVGAFALRVQEAALTGESAPVDKLAGVVPAATPLAERTATVHAGTVVAAGRATALVVATGMETELGRIAGLLGHTRAEQTPLQRRLAELGRWLIVICLAVVGVIFVLDLARGGRVADVLLRAVSLAVAAVPEGLPAVVTVVLAIGLERLVARGTLVRRLPSVETLGSVTVICTDTTGTLTRDEMTVRAIETATARYAVAGSGYAPHGEFRVRDAGGAEGAAVPPAARPDLARLLLVAARCGNATVQPDGDGWRDRRPDRGGAGRRGTQGGRVGRSVVASGLRAAVRFAAPADERDRPHALRPPCARDQGSARGGARAVCRRSARRRGRAPVGRAARRDPRRRCSAGRGGAAGVGAGLPRAARRDRIRRRGGGDRM
jgi:magnesium-transporting ATPase (P-type)